MSAEMGDDWTIKAVSRLERFYARFFGELGNTLQERLLQDGWQQLATLEGSIKPTFSTVHWPKDGKVNARAKFVGGLLGHTVAHYQAMCDPRVWKLTCNALNTLVEVLKLNKQGFERLDEHQNPFVDAKPQFHSAIAGAMRYPSRQPRLEQAVFFDGYSKALKKGSVTIDARGVGETTRTPAYQLVAAFGLVIRLTCHSVHDVHRFLEKMLGPQRAGSIKRTEAICKSLNLHFRRAGRPSSAPKP